MRRSVILIAIAACGPAPSTAPRAPVAARPPPPPAERSYADLGAALLATIPADARVAREAR
jgi:hypothetical protein